MRPPPDRKGQTWQLLDSVVTITGPAGLVGTDASKLGLAWVYPAFDTETGHVTELLEFEAESLEDVERDHPAWCRRIA